MNTFECVHTTFGWSECMKGKREFMDPRSFKCKCWDRGSGAYIAMKSGRVNLKLPISAYDDDKTCVTCVRHMSHHQIIGNGFFSKLHRYCQSNDYSEFSSYKNMITSRRVCSCDPLASLLTLPMFVLTRRLYHPSNYHACTCKNISFRSIMRRIFFEFGSFLEISMLSVWFATPHHFYKPAALGRSRALVIPQLCSTVRSIQWIFQEYNIWKHGGCQTACCQFVQPHGSKFERNDNNTQ